MLLQVNTIFILRSLRQQSPNKQISTNIDGEIKIVFRSTLQKLHICSQICTTWPKPSQCTDLSSQWCRELSV